MIKHEIDEIDVKSFYTTMDTCHNHSDKGCGGGGGLLAVALKRSYSV